MSGVFAPPTHLLHGGDFHEARDVARNARRWLLINIQRFSEFSCHTLNRDVWRDVLVENMILEGFILWQAMDNSPEGKAYIEHYRVLGYPHIAIIDPRTGTGLLRKEGWTKERPLTAEQFAEMAMRFCSLNSFDKEPLIPPRKQNPEDTMSSPNTQCPHRLPFQRTKKKAKFQIRGRDKPTVTAAKRLQKELDCLNQDPMPHISAAPVSSENLLHWEAMIIGPKASPYANGVFFLDVQCSEDYPFIAPKFRFKTPIYHYSVQQEDGAICTDILAEEWSPALTIGAVLLSICSLLAETDIAETLLEEQGKAYYFASDPDEIAATMESGVKLSRLELFLNQREEYDRLAREWTKEHAT